MNIGQLEHVVPAVFFAEASEGRSFRLAISDSSYRGLILTEQDFAPLRDESGFNIELYRASSDSCLSAIRQDIADVAILPGPVDEVAISGKGFNAALSVCRAYA